MSSGNNRFSTKTAQSYVFQLEWCANPEFCSFHEYGHLENSCSDWKRVAGLVCDHAFNTNNSTQGQLRDTDDGEVVAPDEALSSGHVVNMYQCSQAAQKINIEKQS